VKHFARLGLTAIRLHCWDREISDHQGNLIENDHLRLLDLLISECANSGIYTVLTPIAWWNSPTGGGFSDLYTMHQMTTDPAAREVQCNYLRQFVNHVNQFRKRPYRDDPAVAGFETINEPIYPPGTTDGQVVEYIPRDGGGSLQRGRDHLRLVPHGACGRADAHRRLSADRQ